MAGVTPDPAVHRRHAAGAGIRQTARAPIWQAWCRPGASRPASRNTPNGPTLCTRSKADFGVDGAILVSIWGIESSFGEARDHWDVFRSLATLAQAHFQHPLFRNELLSALDDPAARPNSAAAIPRLVGRRHGPAAIPAVELFDLCGRFRRRRAPRHLDQRARRRSPRSRTICRNSAGRPACRGASRSLRPRGSTTRQAAARSRNGPPEGSGERTESPFPRAGDAILFFPSGAAGPAFLVTGNFVVIKQYNNSDAYALAVGELSDRHPRPWPDPRALGRRTTSSRRAASAWRCSASSPTWATRWRISTAIWISTCATIIREMEREFGMIADGYPSRALLERMGVHAP